MRYEIYARPHEKEVTRPWTTYKDHTDVDYVTTWAYDLVEILESGHSKVLKTYFDRDEAETALRMARNLHSAKVAL